MRKKFYKSPYFRGGVLIIVCGIILIVFNNWISGAKITIGFQTFNKAMTPVYIGILLSFLMCPIFNRLVAKLYPALNDLSNNPRASFNSINNYKGMEESADTPIRNMKNFKRAKMLASVICLLIVVGVISLLVYFIVPQLITSSKELIKTAPEQLAAFSTTIANHLGKYPGLASHIDKYTNIGFNEVLTWLQNKLTSGAATDFASTVSSGVVTVVGALTNALIGILIMIYILNYKERLFSIGRKIVNALFKDKAAEDIYEFVDILDTTFIGFFVGRIIDSAIIGVLTFICLIIFGMPYASMIAVVVGVTNVIPFFGPFIGAIPSVILLLIEDPQDALLFIVLILIIQQLDGNVIGPKIVGNAVGIESFWVLIAVLVGGKMFGFMGMLFSVPVFAVAYRYVDKLIVKRLDIKDKDISTDEYMSLEKYGIDKDELAPLSMDRNKEGSRFFTSLGKMADKKKHANDKEPQLVDEANLIDTTEDEGPSDGGSEALEGEER